MNIRKIAELAGVSVATVSRVFNHPERVLPETLERVLAVTREHDFTPNWFARGLTLGTTKTITLLIPDIESDLYRNLISGIETVAKNKGYVVILCQTRDDPATELELLKMMKKRKVEGVIQVQSQLDLNKEPELASYGIPRVHIGRSHVCGSDTLCYFDYEEASYKLFKHLMGLGHKSFVLLYSPRMESCLQDIEQGLGRLANDLNVKPDLKKLAGKNTTQAGYNMVQRMAQSGARPDVLITMTNLQAIGVLKGARDISFEIPEDLALASFDDSPVYSLVSPAITGMEMPAARLGMASARMLFDHIEDSEGQEDVVQEMILQPKLKIRESCGNKTGIFELFD